MPRQFVVQLDNRPGAMASLAETLAARGGDLRAIGGGGIGDTGHVIMPTADDDTTRAVLEEGRSTFVEDAPRKAGRTLERKASPHPSPPHRPGGVGGQGSSFVGGSHRQSGHASC